MEFNILGPPELSGSGSRDAKLSPQLWCVVASLLMSEGKPVSVDSLIEHLWGWDASSVAAGTVRTYVSRVNALLTHGGLHIAHRPGGYELRADPQTVDLHRFRSLRRQAESVADSGDLSHAVTLLRQADDLWRGPLLMGLSGDWAAARRQALDDEHLETAKLRIRLELDLGRQASILGDLRDLHRLHPFDEEIAVTLMIALFRLGRRKDAIQLGRDVSERIASDGAEPGPRLKDIHVRILRGDAELGVTPAYRSQRQAGQPNTLPPADLDFVGRMAETESLIADCHANTPLLEAIEGLPGVGKTALALHVAHRMSARYPDAQLYLPFPADSPDAVAEALHRLLRMIDVPATRIPAGTAERANLWRAEMLHRRAVIVLDDVPGTDQVTPLVLGGGDSLTLVTSRQHADWPGRLVLRLEPLRTADSVVLLQRAAGSAITRGTDKETAAAALCGGWPLAIRVVASRLRETNGDLDSLIEELKNLHAGRADSGDTARRISSAFEVTYRQLSATEKRLFRILGASPCADFGIDSAAALTGETRASTVDGIRALCGHCLAEQAPDARFRFHDLVRSFAIARCSQEEPDSELRRAISRLIHYYSNTLSIATMADHDQPRRHRAGRAETVQPLDPAAFPDPGSVRGRLESEWRNILLTARYAAGHEWHRQCADLTHSLAGFLQVGGYWGDAITAHELGLHACRLLGDSERRAMALLDLSAAYRRTGEHGKARRHADEALATHVLLGDQRGQAAALDELGLTYQKSGSARSALAHHQEAGDLYLAAGDHRGRATATMHAATAFGALGRYAEEASHLEQALRIFQEICDRRGEGMCLNNLGAVLEDRGMHRDAVDYYERSIAVFRETPERQSLTLLDHNLGHVQEYKGNHDQAIAIYRRALTDYHDIGDLHHEAVALSDIGTAFASKGCYSEALVHHQRSAALAETIGDRPQLAAALCGMGDAHHGLGSYSAAAESYDKAHRLAAEIEAPYLSGKALYGMAETLCMTQGPAAAKIYWREAYDIFGQLGVPQAAIVQLRLYGSDANGS
jgi:DNA-binding SARP family transcriptional activator/tetratricopeptide (TPR) repeat protein